jgi:hypothetical protein
MLSPVDEKGARVRLAVPGWAMGTPILLFLGVLYLVTLFLPWRRQCVDWRPLGVFCGTQPGLGQGVGAIDLLLVVGLIALEVVTLIDRSVTDSPAQRRGRAEAALAAALAGGTIVKVLIGISHIWIFSFVGLALAGIIAFVVWQRRKDLITGRAPAGDGNADATADR